MAIAGFRVLKRVEMKISERRQSDYLAPHITVVRSECEAIMAGSITGEAGDFGWGAKEDNLDWDDDDADQPEGNKGNIDLWGDDF